MSKDKSSALLNKQARFQMDYVLDNHQTESEEDDEEDDDQFIKEMRIQEKLIFGDNGSKNDNYKVLDSDQNASDDNGNQFQDIQKSVEKKLAEKNLLVENGQQSRQGKEIENLLKAGKKSAIKDSVVNKNKQKFNNQVDNQLKKQNLVVKQGAIKSGFDVIASTNQILKKQYEESVKLEEHDQQFAKKEQKFVEMMDSLKFINKKKELQLVQLSENLHQQQLKLNGDNYGQSQIFNVSVNASNSNLFFNSSYYSNKFVTTLNQHSILGCRATSTFALKDNEDNQRIIQQKIDELKEQLEEQNKRQFHEETQEEVLDFKVKEMQATKVVLQKESQNYQLIIKNYDTQLKELNTKLEDYQKQENSISNQCFTMAKFITADEEQKKEFLNKRKGNYECYKVDIKNALQEHNQIQQQIEKATIQLEKMKLEIEELDYQAKIKRQLTLQSNEMLSILENFDLLCDVFIYNDPSISNIMEIDNAYELTNKKRVVGFQEPVPNNNNANSGKANKKKKFNNTNANADQNSTLSPIITNLNKESNQHANSPLVSQTQTPNTHTPLIVAQRLQSNFNSKENTPSGRSKSRTTEQKNEENTQEQSKSKFSEAVAASSTANKSFSALSKETPENQQDQQRSKEGSLSNIDDAKNDQNQENKQEIEEIPSHDYKYKQGDIILRLTQFYAFHKNDLEKAVNSVIQTFKSYNNDHDTLKTRIVDLSIQKKNLTHLQKKYENELWEYILVFGDIKKQDEEEELQKKINRRLNISNEVEDQDSASKNLLSTNQKKNNFNDQTNEQDLANEAQTFEGQLFLFLNESLFRLTKTITSIKNIICYSELFKEDMDVQNYYFKNDLFSEIQDILRFSLQTKMVYQESDIPLTKKEEEDSSIQPESNRQSITGEALKNQILYRDQMVEKSSHNQMSLAKTIIKKYLKSSISKLTETFSPNLKKHDKLDILIELIRNDIAIMYFCSIETFQKFTGDIKEKFMRQYDVESVKEAKQIENLYTYAIDHLNELRGLGEEAFRVYLRRLVGFYEYILLHIFIQSDKVWYDIKAYDPKFFLKEPMKVQERKKKSKRTWREKLISNKIKAYENYLGLELDKNENTNAAMSGLLKEQISSFLTNDGQKSVAESENEETQYFEEKRDNLKYPKIAVKLEMKRKAYEIANNQDDSSNQNTTATSFENKYVQQPINMKQEKQIIRIDKEKMRDELQRCIGIKKNFQRMIQETDLSALSKTVNINNNSNNINPSAYKLTSASLVKTEEGQTIHTRDYPFSKVFYHYKGFQPKPSQSKIGSNVNQSLLSNKKEEKEQQIEPIKRYKRSISQQQVNQGNIQKQNLQASVERKIKTSQESKKYEHKKQQSLPVIKSNNIGLSASQRNIAKNLLPHQRHIINPSAQSIRYDPNSSRITDNKSEAVITKKNSSMGIPFSELNGFSSQGTLFQKGDSLQSLSKKGLVRQQNDGMQLEDLLGKQIYSVDSEANIIHSGILSDDFNKNKSIFPNIPHGLTEYAQFSNKNSILI